MDRFEKVTIIKKANVYFDGKVTSRTVLFGDGTWKTLGFMQVGEYEFRTAEKEVMEILSGTLKVLIPGNEEWQTFKAGQTFEVPAQVKFQLQVQEATDYCCSYLH